jgi:uncharacterized protein (TIGR03118 family)
MHKLRQYLHRVRPGAATPRWSALACVSGLAIAASTAGATTYDVESLVTDNQEALAASGFEPAAFVDPNLINPWGMSFSSTGPFWVSNQGSATSTLYNGSGQPQSLIVSIPQSGNVVGPTGQVFNGTTDFHLASGDAGLFFFANLDGSISGWNGASGTTSEVVVPHADANRTAIYTGLALGSNGGTNYLYAANNATGHIDVFDSSYHAANLAGNFTDPGANPDGLVPFNVQNINGLIYVTYAVGGPEADEAAQGQGFVSVFKTDGSFVGRLIDVGVTTSPWGLAIAPDGFGKFSGALLVGNFHEDLGNINAFDPDTGQFLGELTDEDGNALIIPYLWTLLVGNGGSGGDTDDIYFTAGIGDEVHGLLGEIDAVPLPAALPLLVGALGGLFGFGRRRNRL